MADEVASAALSTGQKTVEVMLELIKMMAPLAKNLLEEIYHKSVDGINTVGGRIANAKAVGTVSNKGLVVEAQKANSPISTTSNFLARDAERVAEKAKEYKIPVVIVGNGDKRTIEFLDRDKGIIEQITNEIMQERLKGNPQSVKCFSVGANNVSSMKQLFEENGIEYQFIANKDGKISCIYPAECAEQVAVIKSDYKVAHTNVEMNCEITPNIPETETLKAIKSQIAQLESDLENTEARSKFYEEISADTSIDYPVYSEGNMERISEQMPEATRVAGKAFWEERGYTLSENAKGIEIIAPQVDDKGEPVLDDNGKQTFTSITVYDISETNAYEKSVNIKIAELQSDYDKEKMEVFSTSESKSVTVSDKISGKSVEITVDGKTRKNDVMKIMRDELGYSAVQSDIAANKLCYDIGLDKTRYFSSPTQTDNIDALKTNIRYASDDLTIRDIRYDAVNFRDGKETHLILQNGENAVGLTPAKMSKAEMKEMCVSQLGLSEYQAEKAVDKAVKIESQVRSQMEDRTVDKQGITRELSIERTSNNVFIVKSPDKTKVYDFSSINLEDKIANDFDIPKENARNIISKANNQSVLQNKIRNAVKKKSAPSPEKPKLSESKVMKR
ncbi:MAG: hypothetical protein J1F04_08390 [Oscillospiraceae bacterium]|nr:hypothetical protein [Oscillospiraceae bacterium]